MKLNDKQKEILVDCMFDVEDLDWIERSFEELKNEEIEIEKDTYSDWWNMYVYDRLFTQLNFECRPEVLKEIMKNK